jgi:hypothetical protein
LKLELSRKRRPQSVIGAKERHTKGVANGFKNVTAVSFDRESNDRVMLSQRLSHLLRMLFPKLGASFDIRKKKRDRSGWKPRQSELVHEFRSSR